MQFVWWGDERGRLGLVWFSLLKRVWFEGELRREFFMRCACVHFMGSMALRCNFMFGEVG